VAEERKEHDAFGHNVDDTSTLLRVTNDERDDVIHGVQHEAEPVRPYADVVVDVEAEFPRYRNRWTDPETMRRELAAARETRPPRPGEAPVQLPVNDTTTLAVGMTPPGAPKVPEAVQNPQGTPSGPPVVAAGDLVLPEGVDKPDSEAKPSVKPADKK
jgi:hypothetical protein